jgi:tRNA(Arg) A34 adenosine deaminase TadA
MKDGHQKEGGQVADRGPRNSEIVLRLPPWLGALAQQERRAFDSTESRMRFAIELARQNVEQRTGGPFGAAVFEAGSGKLVSVGVNLVEASNCSMAHAEMMAIALAQQAAGHCDLSAAGVYELATSTEPCAMCLGAIPWSGVRRVVCAAHGEDAAAIGFDEGAKPADWVGELQKRGIAVVRDVRRDEARDVLQQYAKAGGLIYNPGRGT